MPTDFFGSLAARIFSPGRMAKYIRGLLTGYGSLGVALVFTAVTVPMGISSLGLAGWGIWVFCQQASAAICLFESFTQSAFVRLLIQVKDDSSSESYKMMVWMGRVYFGGQGLLIFILHAGFAAVLPALFPNVGGTSGWETIWLMGLAALVNQAGKINGQLLFAHQHQDRASLAAAGGILLLLLSFGPVFLGRIRLDINSMLVAAMMLLVGFQLLYSAIFLRIYGFTQGFLPDQPDLRQILRKITLEKGVVAGLVVGATGFFLLLAAFGSWMKTGFGALDPVASARQVVPAVTLLALGIQVVFGSFFLSSLGINRPMD